MGLSPQLTLEAAILREGGFEDIDAGSSVSELVYVRLSGNNPPGEQRIAGTEDQRATIRRSRPTTPPTRRANSSKR